VKGVCRGAVFELSFLGTKTIYGDELVKRSVLMAMAFSISVGAWSPPTPSLAETTCVIERRENGPSYTLFRVCTTTTQNMQTMEFDMDITYENLGTFYYT
jgi:hypothetical protein